MDAAQVAAAAVLAAACVVTLPFMVAFLVRRSDAAIRLRFPALSVNIAVLALALLTLSMVDLLVGPTRVSCAGVMVAGYVLYVMMAWSVVLRAALVIAKHRETTKMGRAHGTLFKANSTSDEMITDASNYTRSSKLQSIFMTRRAIYFSILCCFVACAVMCVLIALYSRPYAAVGGGPSAAGCYPLQEAYLVLAFAAIHWVVLAVSAAFLVKVGATYFIRGELFAEIATLAIGSTCHGVLFLSDWPVANIAALRAFPLAVWCFALIVFSIVVPVCVAQANRRCKPLETAFPMLPAATIDVASEGSFTVDPERIAKTAAALGALSGADEKAPPSQLPRLPKITLSGSVRTLPDLKIDTTNLVGDDDAHGGKDHRRSSLDEFLDDDKNASDFQIFLMREFSAENLFFYRMAAKFAHPTKKLTPQMRLDWAVRIFNDFLSGTRDFPWYIVSNVLLTQTTVCGQSMSPWRRAPPSKEI